MMLNDFIKIHCISIIIMALLLIIILFIINYRRQMNFSLLKKAAYTDILTGGSNLAKFKLDAQQLFSKFGTKGYAIIHINIDKFKYINDMFGYSEGDKTLKFVYNVLISSIENNELCARTSDDLFVLLVKVTSRELLIEKIQKIFDEISQYESLGVEHAELIIKCGIYIIEPGENNLNTMINLAIITQETIKNSHKSKFVFYTDELKAETVKIKEIENQMRRALNNKEFIVYMQPKYDLKSRRPVGAEALVRWKHPHKGILQPIDFIPIFEKNGFVVTLDLYVFETVCKQIRWWLDNDYQPLPVSINISRINLNQSEFVSSYKAIVKKYNIPSELLEFELTESAIFENQDLLISITDEFKKMGILLSIDDFGSGYSCLSLLSAVPIDILKIDRKFLMDNFYTDNGKIVIEKIIELAKSLKLQVVSEGVETAEQEEFLKNIGCDMAQGYLYAHPMPIGNFNALIE